MKRIIIGRLKMNTTSHSNLHRYELKALLALWLLLVSAQTWAQQHEHLGIPDVLFYEHPDTAASFPGGSRALAAYLSDHVSYPQGAKENLNIPVTVEIETDGTILSAKADDSWYYQQYAAYLAAAERVVKQMPRWTPARYDGRPVRQRLYLFVPFRASRKEICTDDAFPRLFPPINPDSLHIFSDQEVFKGDTIDYPFTPQLFDILPDYLLGSSGNPMALGRYALDERHTALLIRHNGAYDASQISLFIWDSQQHRITASHLLADVWGDAGYVYAKESWIDKGQTIVSREASFYIDLEQYFQEEGNNLDEAHCATQPPIVDVTDTLKELRWCDSLFRTTLLPFRYRFEPQHMLTTLAASYSVAISWLHAQCPCTLLVPASQLFNDPSDKMPQYPGGDEAMLRYVADNLRWPGDGQCDISGYVYLLITIEEDGTVGCVCTLRDLGCQAGQEAERLARAMPRWHPAEYHGQPVRSQTVIKIPFVRL